MHLIIVAMFSTDAARWLLGMVLCASAAWGQRGEEPAPPGPGDVVPGPERRAPERLDQRIPGTVVTIEMTAVTMPGASRAAGSMATGEAHGAPTVKPLLWVSTTEVTWDAYDAFVYRLDEVKGGLDGLDAIQRPSNPYILADYGFGHAGFPAISVSHRGAGAFCEWLSARTGHHFRLPTEEEWTTLCARSTADLPPATAGDGASHGASAQESRGGVHDGSDADRTTDSAAPATTAASVHARRRALKARAWSAETSGRKTHAVATLPADALGLHDLLGNVGEWCTAADGSPVLMGGSFRDGSEALGCARRQVPDRSWNARDPQIPKSRWWLSDANFAGFRIVCDDRPGDATAAAPPATPDAPHTSGEPPHRATPQDPGREPGDDP